MKFTIFKMTFFGLALTYSAASVAALNEQCDIKCSNEIVQLETYSSPMTSYFSRSATISAFNSVAAIASQSSFQAVRLKALDMLRSPSESIKFTRTDAMDAIMAITILSKDAAVEDKAIDLLTNPLNSLFAAIREEATKDIAQIALRSTSKKVKQHAIYALCMPSPMIGYKSSLASEKIDEIDVSLTPIQQ